MQDRPSTTTTTDAGAIVVVLLCGAGALVWLLVFVPARESARMVSCQANLKQMALAATAYTQDYDGHLPPRPKEGDWFGRRWRSQPSHGNRGQTFYKRGPAEPDIFWPYLKNMGILSCPSDPDNQREVAPAAVRSSYDWNHALSGKLLKDVSGQPLVWDRAPFHRRGRNVGQASGTVWWTTEKDFQDVMSQHE